MALVLALNKKEIKMTLREIEQIAKVILGSGLFAFLIAEIWRTVRGLIYKKRIIKELAFEFFFNERISERIIYDFQNLILNPCGYLWSHRFKTQVMDPIISSAYFVNLNSNLVRFLFEFDSRFKKVQYELDRFFILEDSQKLHANNIGHLVGGELDSKLLLSDLIKSKKLKELKKKYYKKWMELRIKRMEERYNKKMDKKKKKIIIKYEMKKINEERRRWIMNIPQKIVIGITIMLIGCIFIMYITLTKPIMPTSVWGEPELAVSSLLVIILGIVLIAGGLVVLFSIKKK